jgi:hypothetical protein
MDTNSARVRQTGLFYQTVWINNPTLLEYDAIRLWVSNVPPAVRVWNATGTNGVPYIQYNYPIAAGTTVALEVEFYATDRRTVPNPVYAVEVVTPETITPEGAPLEITARGFLSDNSFMVEFNTLSNRVYYVQYRANLDSAWKTALPAITGNGRVLQWIDYGPPKTESPPDQTTPRYYRALLLP